MNGQATDDGGAMVCVDDFEREAYKILPRNALDYYRSGADEEQTLGVNKEALRRLRIRPRMLRDVSRREMTTTALGSRVSVPFGVAPTAMQRMAHPDGELANVRGQSLKSGNPARERLLRQLDKTQSPRRYD